MCKDKNDPLNKRYLIEFIKHHNVVGNFNIIYTPIDKSSKPKLNKKNLELNNALNQMSQTDI